MDVFGGIRCLNEQLVEEIFAGLRSWLLLRHLSKIISRYLIVIPTNVSGLLRYIQILCSLRSALGVKLLANLGHRWRFTSGGLDSQVALISLHGFDLNRLLRLLIGAILLEPIL